MAELDPYIEVVTTLNLGDSGIMIIRPTALPKEPNQASEVGDIDKTGELKIQFRSKE